MQILLLSFDRKSSIYHWIASVQILYIMTLSYIFKATNFECEYLENGES